MTDIEKHEIDNMSHEEMARTYRFALSGNKYFVSGTEITDYFFKKFKEYGSMTPEISKKIGW